MAVSTYILAEEAYAEVSGALPSGFVAPSATTPTYGGFNTAARRALRDLGYDVSSFPTTPVAVLDDEANDFRNLLAFYSLLPVAATATGSASEIQAGPVRIKNSTFNAVGSLLAFYRNQVESLLGLVGPKTIGQTDLLYTFDLELDAQIATYEEEYGRLP